MTAVHEPVRLGRVLTGSLGSQGLAGVLRVLVPAMVARAIGPADLGTYAALTVMVLVVFNLANLGVSSALTHRSAGAGAPQGTRMTALSLSGSLGIAATLAVAVADLAWLGESGIEPVAVVAYLSLPAVFLLNSAGGAWLGAQRFGAFNLQLVGLQVLLATTTVLLLTLSRTLMAAVAAWTIAYVVAAALALAALARSGALRGGSVSASESRELVAYGVRNHVSTLVTFLSYRLDILLVVALVGSTEGGYYAAAVTVAETVWFFSQVASTVLFATVSRGADTVRDRAQHQTVTRIVTLASILAAVVLAVGAPWVMTLLYSSEFVGAAGVLRILLVATVVLSVSRMFANYIAAIGHPGRNIWGSVTGLVVNVVLNLVLIPRYGMAGAAWASVASYTTTLVSRLVEYTRLTGSGRILRCLVVQPTDLRLLRSILLRRSQRAT